MFLERLKGAIRRRPLDAMLVFGAILASLYVVVFPFTVTRYVPMTDVPFHAANTGILRHYFDPDYHLREQFEIVPIGVPYMSTYVIGALAMFFVPSWIAVKISAAVMLGLLPLGLGVMFHGMKKSPLLGLAGLPFVWNFLTHWGFLNYVGAIGLFCAVIGLTLLVLDKPTFTKQLLLSAALVTLFFTHIFRFPFALLGVVGTTIVMYPATRRVWPVIPPLGVPLALLFAWLRARPPTLRSPMHLVDFDRARLPEFFRLLLEGGFLDPSEAAGIVTGYRVLGMVAMVLGIVAIIDGRLQGRTKREWAWFVGVFLVTLGCTGAFFLLFMKLPMEAGLWWYIYPRECMATALLALGFLPDLPRFGVFRAPLVAALALGPWPLTTAVADNYREFDRVTTDFHRISRDIPIGPKLMYLVFDHGGTRKKNTPFIHLPAYIQAEKGGWLGFHFSTFGTSPILYRNPKEPGVVVPPSVPVRWEWTPQRFSVREHGSFFDWFLVRHPSQPGHLFRADPTIVLVDHVGSWWLYRRENRAGQTN
ncbi:MAG TPA: hypothetical protein PK156_30480 [Polyangium sp.]|nr:hypothetical protein [Polyangium sp.]